MTINAKKLQMLLVGPGHISEEQFQNALSLAKENKQELTETIIDQDLIKDHELGQLIAQDIGFAFINLRQEKIDDKVLCLIPEAVARARQIVSFAQDDNAIKVGMTDPGDLEMIHVLEKRFGRIVKPYYITKRDWGEAMTNYRPNIKDGFEQMLGRLKDSEVPHNERDTMIVKMVDELLTYASQNRASDIHIEPQVQELIVRFRIDSIMHRVLTLPLNLAEFILMRIKIMAKMRTDEHRSAQDGKFKFKSSDEIVDVRVSIVPVTGGENIVMRLLSAKSRQMGLGSLGLGEQNLGQVEQLLTSPHGMILVTGPTGCGKTTTLYAALKILNRPEVNIATIEDPVEYDIFGISQIQVNTKTNLTFARGLRAIVRQDPDIIMVGEIRDQETASIAINSAMTGHLVLSTLHANDAATTLLRLLDMGIEPFLAATTVKAIIAQRLVRSICPKCRKSYNLTGTERKLVNEYPKLKIAFQKRGIDDLNKTTLYKGEGCRVCANSGYAGRIGIFEVMKISKPIKDLIIKQADSDRILEQAVADGMNVMLDNGLKKALNGATTLEEVVRVTESKG